MGSYAKHVFLCNAAAAASDGRRRQPHPAAAGVPRRAANVMLAASALMAALAQPAPLLASADDAPAWGTRSFLTERYFQPGLTPEQAAARIRQTAESMRAQRPMLDSMAWRYMLFYVRLKSAYLDDDLKTALAAVPPGRRAAYIKAANELVDSMTELDHFVRSPKVYESYLYYEKSLKSLDEVVSLLA